MFREAADLPFSRCIDDHEIADFPIHEIYEMEKFEEAKESLIEPMHISVSSTNKKFLND